MDPSSVVAVHAQEEVALLNLPSELLGEILKCLQWDDVLRLRRTCRRLGEITKTRYVWKHLVEQYIASNAVRPRLERPIALYSSLELERMLLRWMSAQCALNSDTFRPARQRVFKGADPYYTHLVTGGRWFLVISKRAYVTYYDLDSESISGVELIPDQMAGAYGTLIEISIDEEVESPFLEFSVAFSLIGHWISGTPIPNHFQIWRIKAVLDDNQHVTGLTAARVAYFPHIRGIGPSVISLRGPHLAFASGFDSEGYYAYVVDWNRASRTPSKYPFRLVSERISSRVTHISLLPRNQLLVISHHFQICDYSSIPEYYQGQGSSSIMPSPWRIGYPSLLHPSKTFFYGTTANIIVFSDYDSGSTLSCLTFDYSSPGASPSWEDLTETGAHVNSLIVTNFLGFKMSILVEKGSKMHIYSYPRFSTDRNCSGTLQSGTLKYSPSPLFGLTVNEEIGRVVYDVDAGFNTVKFAIVDFARSSGSC